MQPTYIPWSGYFNLISNVDRFVFLDDVQFEKQSWQARNRILLQGKECLLSIPVCRTGLDTIISKVVISNGVDWRRKHWMTLVSAYGKSRFGKELLDFLAPFFSGPQPASLSEFNQLIIIRLAEALQLSTSFYRASDLVCGGERSDHLIRIINTLNCSEYLSPRGSAVYLEEDRFEELSGVRLEYQDFKPASYTQDKASEFVSHLSIVDVIANIGFSSAKGYIL